MTNTRIEITFNDIARIRDASDLAELLFPRNRNQQHAFLALWLALKWASPGLVPNLNGPAQQHGISRRTLERVRAKLRRLGLIDHVSRFNARYGYREGWMLSTRFEHSLRQLAGQVASLRDTTGHTPEKDQLLISFAAARRGTVEGERTAYSSRPVEPATRGETP
jgi:hypothetical protein